MWADWPSLSVRGRAVLGVGKRLLVGPRGGREGRKREQRRAGKREGEEHKAAGPRGRGRSEGQDRIRHGGILSASVSHGPGEVPKGPEELRLRAL